MDTSLVIALRWFYFASGMYEFLKEVFLLVYEYC